MRTLLKKKCSVAKEYFEQKSGLELMTMEIKKNIYIYISSHETLFHCFYRNRETEGDGRKRERNRNNDVRDKHG